MIVERPPVRAHLRHRSNTQRSHQGSFLNPFNSLTRNRSKSHMSVATGNDQPPSGIVARVELDAPPPGSIVRRNRFSANYSSHSYLHPEFHTNPYFSKTSVPSPPQPPVSTVSPPSFNAPYVPGGYPGLLSQPATVVYVPQSGTGIQLQLPAPSSSRNWNGTESYGRNLNIHDSGAYRGGASQGYPSYGSNIVMNSSRRGVFHANSSVEQGKEGSLSPDKTSSQLDMLALSQGSELPVRDFKRSGGSMRVPPLQLKPPPAAGNHHMPGPSPFIRVASLSPYHATAVSPYRHSHGNKMSQLQNGCETSPSSEGDAVGGMSDDNESVPVDWEVSQPFSGRVVLSSLICCLSSSLAVTCPHGAEETGGKGLSCEETHKSEG